MCVTLRIHSVLLHRAHEKFTNTGGADTVPVQVLGGVQFKFWNLLWIFQDANFSIPKDNLNFKKACFYERWQEKRWRLWNLFKKKKKNTVKQTYSQLKLTIVPVTAAITIQCLLCWNWFCSVSLFADTAMQILVCVTQHIDSVQKRINSPQN